MGPRPVLIILEQNEYVNKLGKIVLSKPSGIQKVKYLRLQMARKASNHFFTKKEFEIAIGNSDKNLYISHSVSAGVFYDEENQNKEI